MYKHELNISKLLRTRSFKNWALGKASEKEAEYWDAWIEECEYQKEVSREAQTKLLGISLRYEVSRPEDGWNKLEELISKSEEINIPFKRIDSLHNHKRPNHSPFWQVLKYAAILLMVLSGSLIWMMYNEEPQKQVIDAYKQITTEYGQQKEIQLPDGTLIVLNANSSLKYPAGYNRDTGVDIELSGEAYFMVSSRQGSDDDPCLNTFRVVTEEGSVQVLGTSFTVLSRNNNTRVVLEEGEVLVTPNYFIENGKAGLQMMPNVLVEFGSRSNELASREINSSVYTSWKDNRLLLVSTPVSDIVERLEYTFGVEFIIQDSSVLDRTLSGSIENSDLKNHGRHLS